MTTKGFPRAGHTPNLAGALVHFDASSLCRVLVDAGFRLLLACIVGATALAVTGRDRAWSSDTRSIVPDEVG